MSEDMYNMIEATIKFNRRKISFITGFIKYALNFKFFDDFGRVAGNDNIVGK